MQVNRTKSIRPNSVRQFRERLVGAKFLSVMRRGKYLLFEMKPSGRNARPFTLLGHLGMTGRMYLQPARRLHPKHAVVVLELGREHFIFEDTRYFGRLTLDPAPLTTLGPEPLGNSFDGEQLHSGLRRSRQAIKVKLLDQSVVAGVGNIYASEALHCAHLSPCKAASRLTRAQCESLVRALRDILAAAIAAGSTVPLDFAGDGQRDGLFYYGRAKEAPASFEERLRVYNRAGEPCLDCGTPIRRIVQAGRSTYYCPACQRG